MEYILSLCVIFLEFLSLKNFGDTFFIKKNNRYSLSICIFYVVSVFILSNFILKSNTSLKFFIMLIFVIIAYALLYGKFSSSIVLIAAISYFILFAFDYIFILLFFNIFNINYSNLLSSVAAYCTATLLSKFSLFSASYIIKVVFKDKIADSLEKKYFILSIVFPLFSIITLLILFNVSITTSINSFWIVFDVFGIIIANVFILSILERMNTDSKIKQENIILEQRLKSEVSNLEYVTSMYEQQRKLSHDFSNHIHIIRDLAVSNNSKEIIDYTKELASNIVSQSIIIDTHNNTINAIINQKFHRAQQLGISMRFDINDLSDFPLTSNDCVTVLANALDNAIEASSKVFEKIIKVKIIKESSSSIISIINSSLPVNIKDNTVLKTDNSDMSHGYGIKNIKSALGKYNHIFAINYESGFFQMTIIINE